VILTLEIKKIIQKGGLKDQVQKSGSPKRKRNLVDQNQITIDPDLEDHDLV